VIMILFWGSVFLITYTYIIFPVLVILRGIISPRVVKSADCEPAVSFIIAAFNESKSIETKIRNILALDYDRDRIEVVIASDGSNDGTDEIVEAFRSSGVRLLSLPRRGKIHALNSAVETSTNEILVFSDANSIYAPDALRNLVKPFADPEVGGVAGNQKYIDPEKATGIGEGERSYWSLDRLLKVFQSRSGNVISATGAIYAIRRALYNPLPEGVTDDFVASTNVILRGYRLVFEADAVAYEPVAGSSAVEFERKVRVISQGLRSVIAMYPLLNPFKYGFYAVELFSHKILRRLMVFPLLALLITTPFLWGRGILFQVATLSQIMFYALALLGWLSSGSYLGRIRIFSIPFYFCMVYTTALIAAANLLLGRRITLWEPQRVEGDEDGLIHQVPVSLPSERGS
jgi:cellulose synthase/poly-beta-1,6-N-acetylglucosamine synthase-like glycosyltransferase